MTFIDIEPINKELTTIRRLLTAKYSERNAEIGAYLSWKEVFDLVNRQPAVDAVPVVRCGECRHGVQRYIAEDGSHITISDGWIQCRRYDRYKNHKEDWYCAGGERKDDE